MEVGDGEGLLFFLVVVKGVELLFVDDFFVEVGILDVGRGWLLDGFVFVVGVGLVFFVVFEVGVFVGLIVIDV